MPTNHALAGNNGRTVLKTLRPPILSGFAIVRELPSEDRYG